MKRFDLAAEWSKLLRTVSSAVLTFSLIFYSKICRHRTDKFIFLVFAAAAAMQLISIRAGVRAVGGIVSCVERQEFYAQASKNTLTGEEKRNPEKFVYFASQRNAVRQESYFLLALVLFGISVLLDKIMLHRDIHRATLDPLSESLGFLQESMQQHNPKRSRRIFY